jgi:hypothetical protein
MRLMLFVASVLVFLVGVQLFVLTEDTDRYFAWTIRPPLTAACLGAAYWASCMMELLASRQASWVQARIAAPAVLLFTTLTLVLTLVHLDRFHLGSGFAFGTQFVTCVWIAVYAAVPAAMGILLLAQVRAQGDDPPRRRPLPVWLRVVLGAHAVIMLGLGLAMFVAPAAMLPAWPWPLTTLTARAIAAWLLGLGLAAAHATWENDWDRVAVAAYSYLVLGGLELLAVLRYADSMQWTRPAAWIYVMFMASVLLVGAYGWFAARRSSTQPALFGTRGR